MNRRYVSNLAVRMGIPLQIIHAIYDAIDNFDDDFIFNEKKRGFRFNDHLVLIRKKPKRNDKKEPFRRINLKMLMK